MMRRAKAATPREGEKHPDRQRRDRTTGRKASMTAKRTNQRLAGREAEDIIHLNRDWVR